MSAHQNPHPSGWGGCQKSAAIHYHLTPTEDNHRQCEGCNGSASLKEHPTKWGQIIVGDVNTATVSDLVQPTSDAREADQDLN